MSVDTTIHVIQADLNDASQARAIARIVDNYARDPMGDGHGLPPDVLEEMIPALKQAPSARVFLAYVPAPWISDAEAADAAARQVVDKAKKPAKTTDFAADEGGPATFPPAAVIQGRARSCGCSTCAVTSSGPAGHVACGVAICFVSCSTWAAKPAINVHDLAVDPAYRKRGVGRALLEKIKQYGQEIGACKVTLEVREDNLVAQGLYKSLGFGEASVPMKFWICKLDEEL